MEQTTNLGARLARLMNEGRSLMQQQRYQAAADNFAEVVDLVPLYGVGYFDLGTAKQCLGELDKAISAYDVALALLPEGEEQTFAYFNRGVVRQDLGQVMGAIADFRQAQAVGATKAQERLEQLQQWQGPSEQEKTQIRQDVQVMFERGKSICFQRPLESLVLFTKVLQLVPEAVDAVYGRGLANVHLERFVEATVDFTRTLALQPERTGLRAEALFNRASLWEREGRVREALTDLQECLELALDPEVGFPMVGDAEKEQAIVASIQTRLERLS